MNGKKLSSKDISILNKCTQDCSAVCADQCPNQAWGVAGNAGKASAVAWDYKPKSGSGIDDDSDEDSDSDPDGDQDKEGDLLYSFYGTQPMDEQNPQFFEKSKTMQRVLSRREAAALKRTRRQVR